MKKYLLVGGIVLGIIIVLGGIAAFMFIGKQKAQTSRQDNGDNWREETKDVSKKSANLEKPVFTHKMFDPKNIEYITPLGEVNGGFVEVQTLNGIMVDIKPEAVKNSPIEVYAPVDMELITYAHTATDDQPNGDWNLEFRINENVNLTIHHLNNAGAKITDSVGNSTTYNDSRGINVKKPIEFKAGDIIGTTKGTSLANNWNVYVYDKSVQNQFINQKRYENGGYMGERFLNSACPFDYYADQAVKDSFYSLLGASAPGQTKTCGSPSKDKKGTLSGLWYLKKEGFGEEYDDNYANPFSVYMKSDKNITIYEMGKKYFTIEDSNPTYKNPEEITTSHCYRLTDNWNSGKYSGYAYFRIDSDTEMSAVYSPSGSCPVEFPAEKAKKYYR